MLNSKVLFVGLGRMGFHMSSHLSKNKKIDLYVHNRTEAIERKWLKLFLGTIYHFKSEIKFDFIITCLKDDKALDFVTKKIDDYSKNILLPKIRKNNPKGNIEKEIVGEVVGFDKEDTSEAVNLICNLMLNFYPFLYMHIRQIPYFS